MLITATEFKAKCLQILDRVGATGERVKVTKRGKVIAEVVPPRDKAEGPAKAGLARGTLRIVGDIIEPTGEAWDALR
jgi:prevent-host-death family protein